MTFTPDGVPGAGTPAAEPAPAKSGVSKKIVAFGIAGVVVLGALGIGAAYATYSVLGGGAQPEEVLPGNAIAFAKLDLDPGAGQKVALYRLAKKFPELDDKVKTADTSIQDAVFGSMFEGETFGLTYDEIKPWLGKRVAVAAFPASSTDAPVDAAVVLAVTDRDKAKKALDGAEDVGYAFAEEDYVVLSETDDMAQNIVEQGKKANLADAENFGGDVDSLDGGQVSVGWADLGKVWDVANKVDDEDLKAFRQAAGDDVEGRVVLGLHAESDYVELQGNTFGTGSQTSKLGTGDARAMLGTLPSDTVAAASVSGLGDVLTEAYEKLASSDGGAAVTEELSALADVGLDFPADIATVLGSQTAVVVTDAEEPKFGVVTRNDDPQKALDTVSPLVDALGSGVFRAERVDRGLVGATGPELLTALKDGKGHLAGSEKFTRVVADPDGAAVAYVDLAAFVDANSGDPDLEDMKAFEAAGLSVEGGDDASFRLRLSFR